MSENYSNLIQSTIDELITSHPDRNYFNSIMQKFDQKFMTIKKDQPSIQFPFQDKQNDLNPNNLQHYAPSFHQHFTQFPQTQFKVDNQQNSYLTLQSQLTTPNNFPLSTQTQDQKYYTSQYSIPSAMLDPQNYQKYQEEKQKSAQYEAYKAVFWESRAQKEAGSIQQQRFPYLKAQLEEQQREF